MIPENIVEGTEMINNLFKEKDLSPVDSTKIALCWLANMCVSQHNEQAAYDHLMEGFEIMFKALMVIKKHHPRPNP